MEEGFKMRKFTEYTALELAQDEDFIRWVKYPEQNITVQKGIVGWVAEDPSKKEVIEEAKTIIEAVTGESQHLLTDSRRRQLWSRINDSVTETNVKKSSGRSRLLSWYSVAATITLIAILVAWQFNSPNDRLTQDLQGQGVSYTAIDGLITFSNAGNMPHTLLLGDGTKITLRPHSSVRYPERFKTDRREVYLSGEAFFEVSRDPKKPFSVYANGLITRVLGTSFNIRAYEKEANITVAVRTGKVSVFTETESKNQNTNAAFLTPNQQIVFSRRESRMVRSLIDQPVMISTVVKKQSFQFVDEPVQNVFALFEEAYGVDIVYDQQVMSSCYLNASLDGEEFHQHLRLICKAINAQYEIVDGHIIVTGSGCN